MADNTETKEVEVEESEEKMSLSWKSLIGYGLGDMGGMMTNTVLGSFLTTYYTDVAGLTTGTVATMYIFLKLWDGINDPLMGTLMDKAFAKNTKKGKFRPWLYRATPLLLICSILMFTAPSYVNGVAKVIVATVTYLLYEGSYTLFNIPYGSLISAMAHNNIERTTASSIRGMGSVVGGILPSVLFPFILDYFGDTTQTAYTIGITICAVIGFVCCLLCAMWTFENNGEVDTEEAAEASDVKASDIIEVFKTNRSYDALCIHGLFFCISQYSGSTLGVYLYRDVYDALTMYSVMSMITLAMQVISLAVTPLAVKKFGLMRTVRGGILIGIVFYVLGFFFSPNVYFYMFFYALGSTFSSVSVLQQWGMMAEIIDYNEYLTGKRTEGTMYGVFNLVRKIGQGIGSSGAVWALGIVGYSAALEAQTAFTQTAIKGLTTLLPAATLVVSYLALRFLYDMTPEISAKVNAFQAEKIAKAADSEEAQKSE